MLDRLELGLELMGKGMLGIFTVSVIMILVVILMGKLFKPKK